MGGVRGLPPCPPSYRAFLHFSIFSSISASAVGLDARTKPRCVARSTIVMSNSLVFHEYEFPFDLDFCVNRKYDTFCRL